MAKERLDKLLAHEGFGSRKDIRKLLRNCEVLVNGNRTYDPSTQIDAENDTISVDGKEINLHKNLYLMMNKPQHYVCSTKVGQHETVFDLLAEEDLHGYLGGDLALVGRLDVDTEGLLLFTTDGKLNHYLTSPKNHVPKTYLVHLEKELDDDSRRQYESKLRAGIHIEAEGNEAACDCLGAEVEWLDEKELKLPSACLLTIYEGKYHEVKRMFAALGNKVVYLKRMAFACLKLDEKLLPGQYRDLTEDEVRRIYADTGI